MKELKIGMLQQHNTADKEDNMRKELWQPQI